jgi:hypothetical protein
MLRHQLRVVALLLLVSACSNGDGSESVGDKSEWALLQGLEVESRGRVPASPEVSLVGDYQVMSVSSLDKKSRIWIMLWPKSPPFYKQIPGGNFEIPRELLEKLRSDHKVSSTVYGALRSHVTEGS